MTGFPLLCALGLMVDQNGFVLLFLQVRAIKRSVRPRLLEKPNLFPVAFETEHSDPVPGQPVGLFIVAFPWPAEHRFRLSRHR
jgi:hypothetical protein